LANIRTGRLSPAVNGELKWAWRVLGQEVIGGRTVLVRFVISDITPTSARFEQAFSSDGGRSWAMN
jgi:hypothetical protein